MGPELSTQDLDRLSPHLFKKKESVRNVSQTRHESKNASLGYQLPRYASCPVVRIIPLQHNFEEKELTLCIQKSFLPQFWCSCTANATCSLYVQRQVSASVFHVTGGA